MHKSFISICVATTVLAATGAAASAGELDELLAKALEDRSVPAMTVLVIRDGRIAEQAVRGVRAAGGQDPARLDDSWHIGSDGKAMTATLIARLVERGTLSWSAPLKSMLPALSMRPEYADVTLVELLSHRAGLPPNVDEKLIEATRDDPRPLMLLRQIYAKQALNDAPVGPPRADASYSNSGYMIAAAIAERATGKPYETLMREEVFAPLGMTVDTSPAKPGQTLGHEAGKPLSGAKSDIPPFFAPAGATMRLSMRDWAAFAIDQMAGERGQGKLLKASSYSFLHTAQGATPSALGWGVKSNWPADAPIRMLMHAGSNGYWNALIGMAPDSMGAVLVAANAGDGSGAEAQEKMVLMSLMPTLNKGK